MQCNILVTSFGSLLNMRDYILKPKGQVKATFLREKVQCYDWVIQHDSARFIMIQQKILTEH